MGTTTNDQKQVFLTAQYSPTAMCYHTWYYNRGPWHEAAVAVLCILRYRDGPWSGLINRDIAVKIAQMVYELPPPPRTNDMLFYITGRSLVKARWGDDSLHYCEVCLRPAVDRKCWIHGTI